MTYDAGMMIMRFMLLTVLSSSLVVITFVSAVPSSVINIAVVFADDREPIGLLRPNYMQTTKITSELSPQVVARALVLGVDTVMNQTGGIRVGSTDDYLLVPNITCWNVGSPNLKNASLSAIRAANENLLALQFANGTHGRITFVIPNSHSNYLPFSNACEDSQSCIVLGTTLSTPSLFTCMGSPNADTDPLPSDCIKRGRRRGQRRFEYTICSNPPPDRISSDALQYLRPLILNENGNGGRRPSVAYLSSNTSAKLFVPGFVNTAQTNDYRIIDGGSTYGLGVWSDIVTPTTASPATDALSSTLIPLIDIIVTANPDVLFIVGSPSEGLCLPVIMDLLKSRNWTPKAIFAAGGILGAQAETDPRMAWIINSVPWDPALDGQDYNRPDKLGAHSPFPTPAAWFQASRARYPEILPSFTPLSVIIYQAWLYIQTSLEYVGKLMPSIEDIRQVLLRMYQPGIFYRVALDPTTGVQIVPPRVLYQLDDHGQRINVYPLYLKPKTLVFPIPTWDERSETITYVFNWYYNALAIFLYFVGNFVALTALEQSFGRKRDSNVSGPNPHVNLDIVYNRQQIFFAAVSGVLLGLVQWTGTVAIVLAWKPTNLYADYQTVAYARIFFYAPILWSIFSMTGLYVLGLFGHRVIIKAKQYEDDDQSDSTDVETAGHHTGTAHTPGTTSLSGFRKRTNKPGDISLTIPTVMDPLAGGEAAGMVVKNRGSGGAGTGMETVSNKKTPSGGCSSVLRWIRKKRTTWLSVMMGCGTSVSTVITFVLLWNGIRVSAGLSLDIPTMVGASVLGAGLFSYATWTYYHLLGTWRALGAGMMTAAEVGTVLLALSSTQASRLHPDIIISTQAYPTIADSFELLIVIVPLALFLSLLLMVVNFQNLKWSRAAMIREGKKKDMEIERLDNGFRFVHLYNQYLSETVSFMQVSRLFVDRLHAMENPWIERYRAFCGDTKKLLELELPTTSSEVTTAAKSTGLKNQPQEMALLSTGIGSDGTTMGVGVGEGDQKERSSASVAVTGTPLLATRGGGKKTISSSSGANTLNHDEWIRKVMEHPIAFSALSHVTTPNRSPENLAFLTMAQCFRMTDNEQKRHHLAYVIYDTFISRDHGSNFQLNVQSSLLADIRKVLKISNTGSVSSVGNGIGGPGGGGVRSSTVGVDHPSSVPSSAVMFGGNMTDKVPKNLFEAVEKEIRKLWREGDYTAAVKSDDSTHDNPLVQFCRDMIQLSQPLNDYFAAALQDDELQKLQEHLTVHPLLPPQWASSWASATAITGK